MRGTGLLQVLGGSLVDVADGSRFQTSGTVSNSGLLGLRGGTVAAATLTQPAAGRLDGWGRIEADVLTSARLDAHGQDGPFGTVEIEGDLTQFTQGRLRIDLGQPAGQECDQLAIAGHAALDGTLELRTAAGFAGASFRGPELQRPAAAPHLH